jgi:membrane protease YdiL (CAAX protease family)
MTLTGMGAGGIADRLVAKRHALPLSIALHLAPGAIITAGYVLVGAPLMTQLNWPPLLGLVLAMCVLLVPMELGLLLYLGCRRNGRASLRGVLDYVERPTRPSPLAGTVAGLIVVVIVVSFVLSPLDTMIIYKYLFSWIPFESTGGAGGFIAGYPRATVVITLAVSVVLSGIALPAIEELYFRGFLLPRLAHLGRWAPVLNTALFSLYHFWTPWLFLSRLGFFLPTVWATWRKKDLRISLWVHCGANTLTQSVVLIAVLFGVGS